MTAHRIALSPALTALALAFALLAGACTIGGRSSSTQTPAAPPPPASPPEPVPMSDSSALGLWHSSFGAVKIERDDSQLANHFMGVWLYERAGQEVIGYFTGSLRGNVFEFTWHEPSQPTDLLGAGFLVFDPSGASFSGTWWTEDQSRTGDWNGWRPQGGAATPTEPSE